MIYLKNILIWLKTHKRQSCLLFAIIGGLILYFMIPRCTPIPVVEYSKPLQSPKIEAIKIPYVEPAVKPNLPVKKKKVYTTKNKALRDSVVKGDIILQVKVVNGGLEETVMDSADQVRVLDIPAPITLDHAVKEILIDTAGAQVIEKIDDKTKIGKLLFNLKNDSKKFVKSAGHVLMIAGGIAVVGVAAAVGLPVVAIVIVGVVTVAVIVAVIATGG